MHVTVTGSGPTVLRRQVLLRLEVGERLAELNPEHRQCAAQSADADHGVRGAAGTPAPARPRTIPATAMIPSLISVTRARISAGSSRSHHPKRTDMDGE